MKKLTLIFLFFAVSSYSFSQENLSQEQVNYYTGIKNSIAGTFQIQMINTRTLPTVELSFFETIQQARHQSETVYITVSPNCRIKVLSQQEIEAANFLPVEYITFINMAN